MDAGKRTHLNFFITFLLFSSVLEAGYYTHNQKILNAETRAFANPKLIIPAREQETTLVVAVIGDGVDYTLPEIKSSLHVTADGRIGMDYVGDDALPHPYIGASIHYDKDAERFWNTVDGMTKRMTKYRLERYAAILKAVPEMSEFIDDKRVIRHEIANFAFHETQIASLYAKIPGVKILSYRVKPYTFEFADRGAELLVGSARYRINLMAALEQAVQDGAQVISFSHGFHLSPMADYQERSHFKKVEQGLKKFLSNHPDVLLIAPSGNQGGKTVHHNDVYHKMLPCTLPHENVLCVGGIEGKSRDKHFSNKVKGKKEYTLERTERIKVLNPKNMCSGAFALEVFTSGSEAIKELLKSKQSKARLLADCKRMTFVEGTSYAPPFAVEKIVKHMQLAKMSLTQAVEKYLASFQ